MPKKAVMISIRPEWCQLISLGKKTVEVRKTMPNMGVPFKCYIYCARNCKGALDLLETHGTDGKIRPANQKVIGEFVCRNIDNDTLSSLVVKEDAENILQGTCLSKKELLQYLGYEPTKNNYFQKHYEFFRWHISDLVIYDKPKEISDFKRWNRTEDNTPCAHIPRAFPPCETCTACNLKRPPQSWCYVEERRASNETA